MPDLGLALPENARDSGTNTPEPFVNWDRATSSWKTSQLSLLGGLETFSEPWPTSGTMRSGRCYLRAPLVPHTHGTGCGLLPTPSGTSNHGQNHVMGRLDEWGGSSNPFRGTEIGKVRCATFEEWMMGFPTGWTDLMDSVTPSCQNAPSPSSDALPSLSPTPRPESPD